jgi:hypothetical protein
VDARKAGWRVGRVRFIWVQFSQQEIVTRFLIGVNRNKRNMKHMKTQNTAWIVTATIQLFGTEQETISRVIVKVDEKERGKFLAANGTAKGLKWLGDYFKHNEYDEVSLYIEAIPTSIADKLEDTSLRAITPDDVTGGYYLIINEDRGLVWKWGICPDDFEGDITIVGHPDEPPKGIANNIWEWTGEVDEPPSQDTLRGELRKLDLHETATHLELLEAAEEAQKLLEDWDEAVGKGVFERAGFLYEAYQNNPQLLRWFLCHLLETSTKAHHDALMGLAIAAADDDRDYEVLIWAAQFSAYPPIAPFVGAELLYGNVVVEDDRVIVIV